MASEKMRDDAVEPFDLVLTDGDGPWQRSASREPFSFFQFSAQ